MRIGRIVKGTAPLAWVALAMVVPGCGGGAPDAQRLPADQFERHVAEVCATYAAQWSGWRDQASDPSADLDGSVRDAYEIARLMADALGAFEPQDRPEAWREAVRDLDAGLDAVEGDDPPELRHPDLRRASKTLVEDFGAAGCFG